MLPEPNDYYMSQGLALQRRRRSQKDDFNHKRFEANPLQIANLTKAIVSDLQLLPLQPPVYDSPIQRLPAEVVANIFEHFYPFVDPPLECSYLFAPAHWREAIVKRYTGILPWLWGLDPSTVAAKEASKPAGKEWDWELLARQLAQVDICEPGKVLPNLPLGLRNRRRMWRLADDVLVTKTCHNLLDEDMPLCEASVKHGRL